MTGSQAFLCLVARLQHPRQPPDDADVPLRFTARADGRCANVVFPRQPHGAAPSALDPGAPALSGGGVSAGAPAPSTYPDPMTGTGRAVASPVLPADGALPGDGGDAALGGPQGAGAGGAQPLAGGAALGAGGALGMRGPEQPGGGSAQARCAAPCALASSPPCMSDSTAR